MRSTASQLTRGTGGELELERLERLEQAREIWDQLALAAGHPFGSWEWVSAWWRHCDREHELYTFVCRESDGDPVAILPLYVARRGPLRIARFLGRGDLHTPLCRPGDRRRAAAALKRVIGPQSDCQVLIAEKLPAGQGWGPLLGGKRIACHPDPVLRVEGRSWEEYLATRSRNFRKEIRSKARWLAANHELTLRLSNDRDQLERDFETLVELHHSRWGSSSNGVFSDRRASTQRDVAREMLDRGWLRLWIAEIDGRPAAADYGFSYAGAHWFFQSGRDRRYDRLSVGTVLMAHAMREAFAEGAHEIRLLAGDEAYKWRFTDDDYVTETYMLGSGLPGYAGRLAGSMVHSMPVRMRARVLGAGGLLGATIATALGDPGSMASAVGMDALRSG